MNAVDEYHRGALALVKSGAAEDQGAAMKLLGRLQLQITASDDPLTPERRLALETVARCAMRSFLGNVTYDGPVLPELEKLGVARGVRDVFTIGIGDVKADAWLMADGLRGGVVTNRGQARIDGWSPAVVTAAACAVGLAYQKALWALDLCDRDGRRLGDGRVAANGVDLLTPGDAWLDAGPVPHLSRLPAEAWVLGCGNLGQAFLYTFAALPFSDAAAVKIVLQDIDRIKVANASTSIVTEPTDYGKWKTRLCATWLADRDFEPRIIEQRFGPQTRRTEDDPAFLFCGVDNLASRQALDDGGFATVIDGGLGAESHDLTTFRIRTLPGTTPARDLYAVRSRRSRDADFYLMSKDFREKADADECGAQMIANTSVGIPFVGLVVAALSVGQLLARVNGYPALSVLGGDALDLGRLRAASGAAQCVLSTQSSARGDS